MTSLVVCAPMRMEARALRRGSDDLTVLCTGTGPARAARAGTSLAATSQEAAGRKVVVAGIGGGLAPGLRAGDVVVATEVRAADGSGPPVRPVGAERLAELLRGHGLTVHTGPVASARKVAHGAVRDRLAATGASIVDTETYWLLSNLLLANLANPAWCVRVVADAAPGRVLTPLTLRAIRTALDRLPAVGAALAEWALTDNESTDQGSTVREVRADGGTAAASR